MLKLLTESLIEFFFALFEKSKIVMVLIILAIWIASSTSYMPIYLYKWTKIDHIIIQNQDQLRVAFLVTSLIIIMVITPLYFQWFFKSKRHSKHIKRIVKELTYNELFCLSPFFLPDNKEVIYLNENNLIVIGLRNKGILVVADIGIRLDKTPFQISFNFKPYITKKFNKIKKQMESVKK